MALCLSGDSWTLCRVASGVACSLSLLVFPLKDGSHSGQQLWGGGRNCSQLGMWAWTPALLLWASLVAQVVKNPPAMQETRVDLLDEIHWVVG